MSVVRRDYVNVRQVMTYSDRLPNEATIYTRPETLYVSPLHVLPNGQMYVEVNVHLCIKDIEKWKNGIQVEIYYTGRDDELGIGPNTWDKHYATCDDCQKAAASGVVKSGDEMLDWLGEVSNG